MSKFIVAVSDYPWPSLDPERKVLASIGATLVYRQCQSPDEILAIAENADAILTTYAKIPAATIQALKRCKIIARYGIGVDNVDISAATEANILVTNVPDYCIDEVSDHAMALLLTIARKVAFSNKLVKEGNWSMSATVPMYRIKGKTLGLVGFGKIPRAVVPKAQAFGLSVMAYDPYVLEEAGAAKGARIVDFETLLRESDMISIHAPLNEETHWMFNEKALQMMKPTAILVNTARGELVKEEALVRALTEGWIAGAGLDVLETVPPPADSRWFGLDNMVLTPHTAFYSEESLVELQVKAATEVALVLKGEMPKNLVNKEVLARRERSV